MAEGKVREGNGGVDLAPNLRGEGHVVPPQEASASGGRRGGQEPLRLGRTAAAAAGRGQRGDAARESPPPRHASVAPEIGGGREGDELGEKVRDEREGGGGRSVWGPWNGGATPPHPWRRGELRGCARSATSGGGMRLHAKAQAHEGTFTHVFPTTFGIWYKALFSF